MYSPFGTQSEEISNRFVDEVVSVPAPPKNTPYADDPPTASGGGGRSSMSLWTEMSLDIPDSKDVGGGGRSEREQLRDAYCESTDHFC